MWQRGYLCCHPWTQVNWDFGKQRLYWYLRVLCVLISITQSITIPVIPPKKKKFLLVVNTTLIPCILRTLKHVQKFKLHDLKKNICLSIYMRNWDLISFTLQNLYRQLSVYIYHLLYRNYYISYCLYTGLVQIQLIPQVHYINDLIKKIHMPYIKT